MLVLRNRAAHCGGTSPDLEGGAWSPLGERAASCGAATFLLFLAAYTNAAAKKPPSGFLSTWSEHRQALVASISRWREHWGGTLSTQGQQIERRRCVFIPERRNASE